MNFDINPAEWGRIRTSDWRFRHRDTGGTARAAALHSNILCSAIDASFAPASTAATSLTISDGSNVIWKAMLPTGSTQFVRTFVRGLASTPGNAVRASIGTGGSTIVGSVNIETL